MDSSKQAKKILILSANPKNTDRLRLDEEVKVIRHELRLGDKSYDLPEERGAITPTDLRREILELEPRIVHFSGHGNSQGLMLEDKDGNSRTVPSETLANLFEIFAEDFEICCVVLNVCSSENQARAIAAHIDYVIGMRTT
ncbi:MAG: CHAT domain-containing protein [Cyanobacteria bacterium CAN_BIN43]|nr:CHAT domain-containing protein [Cyanobacteria bacterium CAN_BIN43]